ncbi:MAG: hypothetical protein KC635_03865 [Myxococcales bacterium]|nr:hypothetical protein [Myxococcales bacterium]
MTLAPLDLAELTDVEVTLEVRAGATTVWRQERVAASRYGDGQGLTYVGPCDASASPNTVLLWIDDLYGPDHVRVDPTTWRNPTASAPLSRPAPCTPNGDNAVTFDVTVLRAAAHGFFDVAVELDDVFCAAKLDCGAPGARRPLLFPPGSSERVPTAVLGFACTGGLAADTVLWLDDVVVTCGGVAAALDLRRGPGNHYTLADPAPAPFAQVATYRGAEQLTGPGGSAWNQLYFNVAMGLAPGDQPVSCSFAATLSASDGLFPDGWSTRAGSVWPLIHVAVPFVDAATDDFACGVHPLNDPNAAPETGVWTDYTDGVTAHRFAHRVRRDAGDPTGVTVEHEAGGPDPGTTGRVVGSVFGDDNVNGVHDGDEDGVGGVVVRVKDGATALGSAVTGADGSFVVSGVPAGTWAVEVDAASVAAQGWARVEAAPGDVTVVAGADAAVAPIALEPYAVIGGRVYADVDQDGVLGGADAGIDGATVELEPDGGGTQRFVPTSGGGFYEHRVLGGGAWRVRSQPGQLALLPYDGLTTASEVSVGPLLAGQSVTVDFGVRPRGDLGGVVFEDLDGDGVQDAGEAGVDGLTVLLGDGSGDTRPATTDASGRYVFTAVMSRTWQVSVDTTTAAFTARFGRVTPANPLMVARTPGPTATEAPPMGVEPLGAALGAVFADADADGERGAGELGVAGVTVTATRGGDVRTTATDGSGLYRFALPAGTWMVAVDLGQPALSDYAALSTPPTIAAIVVPAGDTPADFGVLEPAEVVGHVFVDGAGGEAADRAWDPEDPVLSGVVVTFADEDAIYATVTATSDVDGVYAALLPPGTWTVGVQQLPGGYAGPFFAPGAGALTLLPGDYAERDIAFESTGGSL